MTFPQLVPTSRTFDAGDYPVKVFRTQNGSEVRILYGSQRVGMKIKLGFANISDATAKLFIEHYHGVKGTFQQFALGAGGNVPALDGWEEAEYWLDASYWGSQWRYESPPQLRSIYPGVSTVDIALVAATI